MGNQQLDDSIVNTLSHGPRSLEEGMGQMGWQESVLHWRDGLRSLWNDLIAWLDVERRGAAVRASSR
jgi:hypothetical protein